MESLKKRRTRHSMRLKNGSKVYDDEKRTRGMDIC